MEVLTMLLFRASFGRSLVLALVVCGGTAVDCSRVWAQPMSFVRRTAGILVADNTLRAVYLIRDLDNSGAADLATEGEVRAFIDVTNASGFITTSSSFFSILQTRDGTVYLGENSSRAVYACRDNNGDNDANDADETRVWFSEGTNGNGYTLPTPNGIGADQSGAIYILNAGVSANPRDAIYRTVDTDGSGAANLAAESSIWADLSMLFLPTNVASAFDLTFIGNQAYFMDLRGSQADAVSRVVDADANGSIDEAESFTFVTNGDVAGAVTVNTGTSSCVTDGTSIYVHQSSASTTHRLIRLTDVDGNGVIDTGAASTEAAEVWNASFLPAGVTMSNSFAIAVGKLLPSGTPEFMAMSSNSGTHAQDLVILLHDLDGDGDFMDASETTVLAQGAGASGFPDNVRQLLFYAGPCPGDFNKNWSVSVQDIFDFLAAYFSNDPRADVNNSGGVPTVQDIFDYLGFYFGPCE